MSTAHGPTRATYYTIFALLMVLLFVTVGIAFFHLGPFNDLVAFLIAAVKAVLVVLYFMHVRYSKQLIGVVACSGLVMLVILVTFVLSDYLTRQWMPGGLEGMTPAEAVEGL